ncbi:hypothetical protein RHSIM_Rhsim09G0089300 [Rhododendron simsii]|uniref:Retrovirus-related Pol polyprotein from transposon TNT 1-94-like beta-barrel domain-containing protein n=1 Tax=Rhododendron simsii TaxID=118357 RepID=A0A834LF01_RHOSS|nr:hypothetical protein RHSIM_Rhsim09G0089300 [Rhododendron simsii]
MEQSAITLYVSVILEGLKQYPPSTRFTKSDLPSVFADILSKSGILSKSSKHSSALSAATGTSSWFFDSACCNHMTSDSAIFSSKLHASNTPAIQTADGSHIHVGHIGHISTPTISLSDTYLIPKLTLNLISIGQLCELGLNVIFSATGCHVQDPRTGKTLKIGRKVGRLYELINLHIPSQSSSFKCVPPTLSVSPPQRSVMSNSSNSLSIWHSRLVVSTSSFFTDPSVDIFLDDVDTGSSELHSAVYPEAPILSDDPTPTPPSPSQSEPPSPPDSSLPTSLPSTTIFTHDDHDTTIPLRHSDRVRQTPAYLRDFVCSSTVLSRHEPRSYREASTNPVWQQAMPLGASVEVSKTQSVEEQSRRSPKTKNTRAVKWPGPLDAKTEAKS